MHRSRINYWSCSKFADFIRGVKKPHSLEMKEWDKWHDNQKKNNSFRYYLAENVLGSLQNFIYFPFDVYSSIKYYIRNRWIDKIHYLKTGLVPGQYYDLDTRILHGLFNELVNFVELELSHLSVFNTKKKYKFKNGRCKEAVDDYFNWVCNLKFDESCGVQKTDSEYNQPSDQAIQYQKIKQIYEWWTISRPERKDPYEIYTKENTGKDYYLKIFEVEKKYEKEDEDMLVELIKLRKNLWT